MITKQNVATATEWRLSKVRQVYYGWERCILWTDTCHINWRFVATELMSAKLMIITNLTRSQRLLFHTIFFLRNWRLLHTRLNMAGLSVDEFAKVLGANCKFVLLWSGQFVARACVLSPVSVLYHWRLTSFTSRQENCWFSSVRSSLAPLTT